MEADRIERELAVTTFDRNVVVTAGAGTGKTTLLVNRLLHLLIREPEPIPIEAIVALTFTQKAAGEMRVRLRARLEGARDVRRDREPRSDAERTAQVDMLDWMQRYRLSASEIASRIRSALGHLDRAHIGTIHSFAATLLRLYPLEANVDPRFQESDEPRWREHVEVGWRQWLRDELTLESPRADLWRGLLERFDLGDVATAARGLCRDVVPLEGLVHPEPIQGRRAWLARTLDEVRALRAAHPEQRKIEQGLSEAEQVLSGAMEGRSRAVIGQLDAGSKAPQGWTDDEFRRAKDVIKLAQRLAEVDEGAVALLGRVVKPFVLRRRAEFRNAGWLSFDGLLVGARDLLRERPAIREALKERFKAVLIDEFQDTDPIQYEILLYMAEARGRSERDWRRIALDPGKLFIVGDPKQSIYGFRGADIEAYQNVVRLVLEQGGRSCVLSENFRSHAGLLNAVNEIGSRLIVHRRGLQPGYEPIHSHDRSRIGPLAEIRLVRSSRDPFSADRGRVAEAESLALWLDEEVIGRMPIVDRCGREAPATRRDVAILLRSLTGVHVLLDALRRREIRYVVEGEKHFFATQEVIDAINLLRVVDAPDDTEALAGLLRSPLGAMNDLDLAELAHAGLLDYRVIERPVALPTFAPTILYRELLALHRLVGTIPVNEAIAAIFDRVPLVVVVASGRDSDQAVANVDKVRRLADAVAAEGWCSLRAVIRSLDRRVREETEEGENPLADEEVDAIRVMSVHKAKGLEFPIVVLAGAHTGIDRGRQEAVVHHWSSGAVGLRIGGVSSLNGVYVSEQLRDRDVEEQSRLLYVAMTRARELFVVSAAITEKPAADSMLKRLEQALGPVAHAREDGVQSIGQAEVRVNVIPVDRAAIQTARSRDIPASRSSDEAERFVAGWRARHERAEILLSTPRLLTPTRLMTRETTSRDYPEARQPAQDARRARQIGILAHRFLQEWDYGADQRSWRSVLERFVVRATMEDRDDWIRDLGAVLSPFFVSSMYRELAESTILGREVPLIMPWEDAMMEGVIDLVYERHGQIYVGDYKSDAVALHQAAVAAERYRTQAAVYTRAVGDSLKRDVAAFRCLFLRLGMAVDLVV